MGRFQGVIDLHNTAHGDSATWLVSSKFSYIADDGCRITVLPGALTDGASIPRLFWRVIGPPMRNPKITAAALIHDQLYKTCGMALRITRKRCDEVFREALRSAGIGAFRAAIMYAAVRVGGSWTGVSRDDITREMQFLSVRMPPEALKL
jgi:hypothetical protein